MEYFVGQYNYPGDDDAGNDFAEPIINGEPGVITTATDTNVNVTQLGFSFNNPFLDLRNASSRLIAGSHYYFHAKIKRLTSDQIFYIKLIQLNTENKIVLSQYLKTIEIEKVPEEDDEQGIIDNPDFYYVDVECVFTPLEPFDGILFEMYRNQSDLSYTTEIGGQTVVTGRIPVIGYIELSEIQNQIRNALGEVENVDSFSKIGVQSRPGLMMCINGEEIHVSRSGIFELRDGIIKINFFSVVGAKQFKNDSRLIAWMKTSDNIDTSFLNDEKNSPISRFTLDYLYSMNITPES